MLFADITAPISLEAPGCPEVTIERVLRDVVRQLYVDNAIWLYRDAAATIETNGTLTMTLPANTQVVEIRTIRTPDGTIQPRNVNSLMFYDHDDVDSEPVALEQNGTWRVLPAPTAALTPCSVLMQLAPAYGATGVDDVVAQRDQRMYEHAALARLLSMPKQAWTDPATAGQHAAALMDLLFRAKRRADGWTAQRTPVVRYGGI